MTGVDCCVEDSLGFTERSSARAHRATNSPLQCLYEVSTGSVFEQVLARCELLVSSAWVSRKALGKERRETCAEKVCPITRSFLASDIGIRAVLYARSTESDLQQPDVQSPPNPS